MSILNDKRRKIYGKNIIEKKKLPVMRFIQYSEFTLARVLSG